MIISIVSGKGGAGKTTTAANLGVALQKLGKKVCVVDANITTSNLGLHLGLVHYPVTLHEVLKNRFPVLDSLYIHESGMRVLPGSLSLEVSKNIRLDSIRRNLEILGRKFDYVIIDSAPGIEKEAMTAIEVAEEILVVTNPELPAITDAIKIIELAKKERKTIKGIVLNKVFDRRFEPLTEEIESVTNVPVIAEIPFDMNVLESIADKSPVVSGRRNSPAAKAFFRLSERITGDYEEAAAPDIFSGIGSLIFSQLRKISDYLSAKSARSAVVSKEPEEKTKGKTPSRFREEKGGFSDFESELKKQILKKLRERESAE